MLVDTGWFLPNAVAIRRQGGVAMSAFELVESVPSVWKIRGMNKTDPVFNWGWHKFGSLVQVVNNQLLADSHPEITKRELLKNYWFLKSGPQFIWCDGENLRRGYNPAFEVMFLTMNALVPAGWGLAVIEAVSRGVRSVYIGSGGVYGRGFRDETIKVIDLIHKLKPLRA